MCCGLTVPDPLQIILAYAGVHDTHDVLPVFLYDLSMRDEALLLDGTIQVMLPASPLLSLCSCGLGF